MSIEFNCECGREVRVKPELAGKRIRCPGCGNPLKVPASESADEPGSGARSGKSEKSKEDTRRRGKSSRAGGIPAVKPAEAGDDELLPTRQEESEGAKSRTKSKSKEGTRSVRTPAKKTEGLLSPLPDQGKTTGKKTFPCPGCGAALYVGDILCITCGMDLSTGQWVLPEPQTSIKSSMAKLIAGLLIGGGLLGVGIWYLVKSDPNLSGNTPPKVALASGNYGGPPVDPADLPIVQDVEQNVGGGLESLAALLKDRKQAALSALAVLAGRTDLPVSTRTKAIKGIALLARRGYTSGEGLSALDTAFGDPDLMIRSAVMEALHLYADPRAVTALDPEFEAPGSVIPAASVLPEPMTGAQGVIQRAIGDPADPLYFPAMQKMMLLGHSAFAGTLVEMVRAGAADPAAAGRGMEALRTVTGRTFATPEEWAAWWDQNSGKVVNQWLVDALTAPDNADHSLAHQQLLVFNGPAGIASPEADTPEAWKTCAEAWSAWLSANRRW